MHKNIPFSLSYKQILLPHNKSMGRNENEGTKKEKKMITIIVNSNNCH